MRYKIHVHVHVYIALWSRRHPLGQKKVSRLVCELFQLASGVSWFLVAEKSHTNMAFRTE